MRAASAVLLVLLTLPAAAADPPARRKLTFFAYDGATAPQELAIVATAVRRKVIIAARPNDVAYVEQESKAAKLPAAANRATFWRDNQSLLLVGGAVTPGQPATTLNNEVFLGALAGQLQNPVFVDVPYKPDQFARTKDSLSALTLYAIAMERLSRGDKSAGTRHLLAEALTIAKQVEASEGGADDIAVVRAAIEKELQKLP